MNTKWTPKSLNRKTGRPLLEFLEVIIAGALLLPERFDSVESRI